MNARATSPGPLSSAELRGGVLYKEGDPQPHGAAWWSGYPAVGPSVRRPLAVRLDRMERKVCRPSTPESLRKREEKELKGSQEKTLRR